MEVREQTALKGKYRFTKAFLETPEQFALDAKIKDLKTRGEHPSIWLPLVRDLNRICRTEILEVENLIPTVGRAAIASHLTSSSPSPSTLRINKAALGTSTTAPANADTQLGTETYRNDIASETNSNNIAYMTGFFSATETTGAFKEAGLFIAGTASANTGTLLSHVAINITKGATETLTIDWTLTIS